MHRMSARLGMEGRDGKTVLIVEDNELNMKLFAIFGSAWLSTSGTATFRGA